MDWQPVKNQLIDMKNLFEKIDEIKSNLLEGIQQQDLLKSDLEHDLELGNLNASESAMLNKALKHVLQQRRIYKDELDGVQCLKDSLIDKYNKKFIVADIIKTLKNLNELEEKKKNRKYNPRIIENLKCVEVNNYDNKYSVNDKTKKE